MSDRSIQESIRKRKVRLCHILTVEHETDVLSCYKEKLIASTQSSKFSSSEEHSITYSEDIKILHSQSRQKTKYFLNKSKWLGKLGENVTSRLNDKKQLPINHYTADCLPPFPRCGSRLIYSLLVVGDTVAYIWLDFPKVTASKKYSVVIKRNRPGELPFFKLL